MLKHFGVSLLFTGCCLALAALLGFVMTHTLAGTLATLWIVTVLGVLETSLSFDNAVIDASVVRTMPPVWRRRFLTWGMLIAVVGMRILFPLLIVAVAAHLSPIEALTLAATDPVAYERIITAAHVGIAGFGGAFLSMVGLTFFLDGEKEVHWMGVIEKPLARLSGISGVALAIVLLALFAVSRLLPAPQIPVFLTAGMFGLVAYVVVDGVGSIGGGGTIGTVARSGFASFLYLEMLDASFSFDGVLGAFALSDNLFVIALGLGIGAMFVRSMTLMLVDKGALAEYRFLEHGAFYAIAALAVIMLLSAHFDIPDSVTGLIGAVLIGVAFLDSVRHSRAHAADQEAASQPEPIVAAHLIRDGRDA